MRSSSKRLGIGFAFGFSVAGSLAIAGPAKAIGAIPVLYGTGVSNSGQTITKPTGGTSGTEVNWQLVQPPNTSPYTPTAAYVPTNTPSPWIGSGSGNTLDDNNGATIDGTTYRWISASSAINALSSSVPGYSAGISSDFNYILSQTFTVSDPGYYYVSTYLTGDNQTQLYFNGSVSGGNTATPTITGGTLVGSSDSSSGNLGRVAQILNLVYLNSGSNTAYLVVNDTGSFTGVLTSNVTFSKDVPGPLPLLGASAAFGWSRRLRRRINGSAAAQ